MNLRKLFSIVSVALLAFALFVSGCASSQPDAGSVRVAGRDPFSGSWDGVWKSTKRPGEGGRLECVLNPSQPGVYTADFRAHWKLFVSRYTASLSARRRGGELRLEGTHRMPAIFGGLYTYRGVVTPDLFHLEYSSTYDVGVADLTRSAPR